MRNVATPFVRRLGIDVDQNIANTRELTIEYAERKYGIHASLETLLRIGVTATYSKLTHEQLFDVLNAPWRDPGAVELVHPRIPAFLHEACYEGELVSYVPVVLSASRGDIDNITTWLREKEIPFEDVLHMKQQRLKVTADVDVQLDDSTAVAGSFGEAKKPIVLTNSKGRDLEEVMDRYSYVHYSAWPDVPATLQGNWALLAQLGVVEDILMAKGGIPAERLLQQAALANP